jgi:formylglycine-generating enzyme required for sulfatase activity
MRLRIAVAIVLALLVGSSVYGAQWKMRVHQPGANTDYTVSEIDSVTFYYDEAPGMVLVPAGTFTMGDGSAGNGEAEFDVTLTNDFYLDQHEVTNQEYIDAVQWAYDNGHVTVDVNRVYDNLDGSTEDLLDLSSDDCEIEFSEVDSTFVLVDSLLADHPTKVVTWYGAARYCDWLSLQEDPPLDRAYEHTGDWTCNGGEPYAAQGEYAAQYDDERTYPWGETTPDCDLANYYTCYWHTMPVGYCSAGASQLGLLDMAGNVCEWCDDWFTGDLSSVYTDPVTDPTNTFHSNDRVTRGGSFEQAEEGLLCACRSFSGEDSSSRNTGFRAARTVSP